MTKQEEIEYLVKYQLELQSVGNDLSQQSKARLRKLQKEIKEDKCPECGGSHTKVEVKKYPLVGEMVERRIPCPECG